MVFAAVRKASAALCESVIAADGAGGFELVFQRTEIIPDERTDFIDIRYISDDIPYHSML